MKTFREILTEADQSGTAIGHFNISDLAALKAVVSAARERGVPVAIGLSESERKFMGTRQAAALVRSTREEHSQPIYLNADHTHSLSSAEEAPAPVSIPLSLTDPNCRLSRTSQKRNRQLSLSKP